VPFAANMPPALSQIYTTGPSVPGFLISEFGCVAGSSWESLSPTLAPAHWSLHGGAPPDDCPGTFRRNCSGAGTPGRPGNVMAQRNYPLDSVIGAYFGAGVLPSLDDVGAAALQRQLYFGLVAPALQQKSHIEAWRSAPTWGTLFWQLNEIWPTTGWGSVEYGVALPGLTPGQVAGGRWKPLMYWLRSTLFADVIVAGGDDGRVYVRNDGTAAAGGVAGSLTMRALSLATGAQVGPPLGTAAVSLPRGAAAITWTCIDGGAGGGDPVAGTCPAPADALERAGCAGNVTACALESTLMAHDGVTVLASNLQLLAPPSSLALARGVTVSAAVGTPAPDGSRIPVTVTATGGAAVLVVLTTLAQGRFSDNALPLLPPGAPVTVDFLPMVAASRIGAGAGPLPPLDAALLAASLRVEHLAQYLQ
jgi:beta-mannosidase